MSHQAWITSVVTAAAVFISCCCCNAVVEGFIDGQLQVKLPSISTWADMQHPTHISANLHDKKSHPSIRQATAFRGQLVRPSSSTLLYLHSLTFDENNAAGLTYDNPKGPRIIFRAHKTFKQPIIEYPAHRTLLEYLALPAEEYSVLDSGTITKKDHSNNNNDDEDATMMNEFTCLLDPIKFLGSTFVACIDAEVDVSPYPEGRSAIRVTGCTLDGSRLARFANGSFDVECTNTVRALREDTKKKKDIPLLHVDCSLEISALVPREGRWLPKRFVSKSGSVVMQQMLNIMVPRFAGQLANDFDAWSAGDDSRSPVVKSTNGAAVALHSDGGDIPWNC